MQPIRAVLATLSFWVLLSTQAVAADHYNACRVKDDVIKMLNKYQSEGREQLVAALNEKEARGSCWRTEELTVTPADEKTFEEVFTKGSVRFGYMVYEDDEGFFFVFHIMVMNSTAKKV